MDSNKQVLKALDFFREIGKTEEFSNNPLGLFMVISNLFPECDITYDFLLIGTDATIATIVDGRYYTIFGEINVVDSTNMSNVTGQA